MHADALDLLDFLFTFLAPNLKNFARTGLMNVSAPYLDLLEYSFMFGIWSPDPKLEKMGGYVVDFFIRN